MIVRLAMAGLLACVCAGTAHAAVPVSFADLARHPQYQQVKISPDGRHLAATAIISGQIMLSLIDLNTGKIFNARPPAKEDVIDFWWASPTRVLYIEGEHVGGITAPLATGELFAIDADGGNPFMLFGYRSAEFKTSTTARHVTPELGSASFLSTIAGDPDHVLIEVTPWEYDGSASAWSYVYKINVHDGQKERVAAGPEREMAFLVDHKGHVRFAFGEDLDGNERIYQRDVTGSKWQLLQNESALRAIPLAFGQDDGTVYFTCSVPQRMAVCTRDPSSGKLSTVWSNANVEAGELLQGLASGSVIGVGFEDGRPGKALFNGNSPDAKALIALMQQFPGENVRFVSGTEDGSRSIVFVDADVDPGTFFLYERDTGKLTPLLKRMPWIDPADMASKQPIDFTARDGMKLQGYISYPPGQESAKHLPMVVLVHGGPYGVRDDWNYEPDVQALATRGYAVLQVNFRGSGGYGYEFEKSGWLQWGGRMQDDVTDATLWAVHQDIADPGRICIMGASYGGYAALEGAVREPVLYKCAIGYAGVYDLPMMYIHGDIPQDIYGRDYLRRTLGRDTTSLQRYSPINQLDRLAAKVMLIVGGEDTRVPPVQGKNLHKALLERRVPHEWLYKPDELHGFYKEENVAELYMKVDAFLQANIGSGAARSEDAAASASVAH